MRSGGGPRAGRPLRARAGRPRPTLPRSADPAIVPCRPRGVRRFPSPPPRVVGERRATPASRKGSCLGGGGQSRGARHWLGDLDGGASIPGQTEARVRRTTRARTTTSRPQARVDAVDAHARARAKPSRGAGRPSGGAPRGSEAAPFRFPLLRRRFSGTRRTRDRLEQLSRPRRRRRFHEAKAVQATRAPLSSPPTADDPQRAA